MIGRPVPSARLGGPAWALALGVAALIAAVSLPAPARGQGRPRIAVAAFDNKAKQPWGDPSWKIGEGLAEMLATELARTGRFTVVERQGLGDVVQEQGLGQSGLVRRETAAATGQILGAQYLVRGAVTEFAEQVSGGSGGISTSRVGLQAQGSNARVAIDLRVIDTSTGEVVASHHVSRTVPSVGGAVGARAGSVTFGGEGFYQMPAGQATRAAIGEAVQFVLGTPLAAPVPVLAVVRVDGNVAYVNAGSSASVKVGDVFQVYSAGEDLIDPTTGLKLGTTERLLGSIRITEVQEKFSIGSIQGGTGAVKRGDRVRAR